MKLITPQVLVPAATIAITVTPDTTTATSIALSLSIRAIGAIGYAIHYNVFVNRLTPRLISYVGGRTVLAGLPLTLAEAFVGAFLAAPESLTQVPGVTPEIIAAGDYGRRWAYAEALKYVWLVSIAFGCIAIIACCFLGSPKKYMTKHIAAHIS